MGPSIKPTHQSPQETGLRTRHALEESGSRSCHKFTFEGCASSVRGPFVRDAWRLHFQNWSSMVNFEDGERYAWGYRGVEWISFASRLNSSNSILEKVCTIALGGSELLLCTVVPANWTKLFFPLFWAFVICFWDFFLTFGKQFCLFYYNLFYFVGNVYNVEICD